MHSNKSVRYLILAFVSMTLGALDAFANPVQQSVQCTPQLLTQSNAITSRKAADQDVALQLQLVRIHEKFLTLTDLSSAIKTRKPEFDELQDKTGAASEQATTHKIGSLVLSEALKLRPCIMEIVRIRDLK